jgi:SlyX protein
MSNTDEQELSVRLEALETRFAFQEDLVNQLDEVIQAQANLLDSMKREMAKMRTEMTHEPETEASMEEQVPPHY